MSKNEELRQFLESQTRAALNQLVADIPDRAVAEIIRQNRKAIEQTVAWHITEEYRFLQLADIMEWKRTRTRR